MRLWISGPRIFGFRTGISIGLEDLGARRRRSRVAATGISENDGFVYIIHGGHGLCKIGATRNPRARLAQLRTASPFGLELAFIGVTTANPFDLEAATHQLLAGRRLDGEWFDVNLEMAKAALFGAAAQSGCKLQEISPEIAERVVRLRAGIDPMPQDPDQRSKRAYALGWWIIGAAAMLSALFAVLR